MSVLPPGGKGTIKRIGRLGYEFDETVACATNTAVASDSRSIASRKRGASQGGRGFPLGSDPGDAHGVGAKNDALVAGFTVASRERIPAPRSAGTCSLLASVPGGKGTMKRSGRDGYVWSFGCARAQLLAESRVKPPAKAAATRGISYTRFSC